jgi:signal transduction histidine kinase
VGGLLGYLLEARRADRFNARTREEVMGALRQLADDESEARRELLEMHRRQKDWTCLVEEEMRTRTAAIAKLVEGGQELQQARASTLLGFSHDLRNPLYIIQMAAEYLQVAQGVAADAEAAESVRDIGQAVERMRRLLGELVQVTKAQRPFVRMAPQRLEVPGATEALRRRLRALVEGRDVRPTVFATREVPAAIEVDPLAFDRIIDNLLTNAAKYTDRGSIVVELDGTPEFLVIKVSDTGCGIEPDALDRAFWPEGSNVESRRGDSFGVGLSVVVQLLGQIGGRLEVMSKPGCGTTFWVHLPVAPAPERASARAPGGLRVLSGGVAVEDARGPDPARVVRIRRLPA